MKRIGLCVGINDYPGTGMDLRGCVNDAASWERVMLGLGFDEVSRLYDYDATRQLIIQAIEKRVASLRKGDLFVFAFSGHGSYQKDRDGDELDAVDEGICPHDVNTKGLILDDELNILFANRRRGSNIGMIADSCFSGTIAKAGVAVERYTFRRPKFMPPDTFPRHTAPRAVPRQSQTIFVLAGCREDEVSYDVEFRDAPRGAMSYWAQASLSPGITYRQWIAQIGRHLPSDDAPQHPVLEASCYWKRRAALG